MTQHLYGNSLECTLIPTTTAQSLVGKHPEEEKKGGIKGLMNGIVGAVQDIFSSEKKMEISSPYNPIHLTHVGYNPETGEFTGLPKEWQMLLEQAGITKKEQQAHPQAIMDIIGFYSESQKTQDEYYMKKLEKVQPKIGHHQLPSTQKAHAHRSNKDRASPRSSPESSPSSSSRPVPPQRTTSTKEYSSAPSSAQTQRKRPPLPQRPAQGPVSGPTTAAPSSSLRGVNELNQGFQRQLSLHTNESTQYAQQRQVPPMVSSRSRRDAGSPKPMKPLPKAPAAPQVNNHHVVREPLTHNQHQYQHQHQHQQHPVPQMPIQNQLSKGPAVVAPMGVSSTQRVARPQKPGQMTLTEVVEKLQAICTLSDPTKLYRNLMKVGQG